MERVGRVDVVSLRKAEINQHGDVLAREQDIRGPIRVGSVSHPQRFQVSM